MKPLSFLIIIGISGFIFMSAGFILGAGIVEKHSLIRVAIRLARAGRQLPIALVHDTIDRPPTTDDISVTLTQDSPQ